MAVDILILRVAHLTTAWNMHLVHAPVDFFLLVVVILYFIQFTSIEPRFPFRDPVW